MRRELTSVRAPGKVLGAVVVDGDFYEFSGGAANIMRGLIEEVGAEGAARAAMIDGWANGAGLYLTDPVPGR